MASLIKDTPRDYELGNINEFLVMASSIIYEGAAVGLESSGYVRPLQAGDIFVGFCEQQADNLLGLGGAVHVRVRTKGLVKIEVPGAAMPNVGQDVYAIDDNTFTLVKDNYSYLGRVYRIVTAGVALVRFEGI